MKNSNRRRWPALFVISFVALTLHSCGKQEKPAATQAPTTAMSFAAPEDASKALVNAVKSDNGQELLKIFGAGAKDLIYSGDPQQDQASFKGFISDYDVMHRWRTLVNGSQILLTGTDNKAFPIPLMKNSAGQWFFDTEAGKQEMFARRIGRNELAAIDVCAAIGEAQLQYYAQRHDGTQQFAQKFISDEGKQNGLYWQSADGQPKSPLGPLVAFATSEGYNLKPDSHQPFHGYFFRMLEKQGSDAKGGAKDYVVNGTMTRGFAVLAYPAKYGDSGIMTFMINQDGVVYQKDLGKTTDQLAAAITEFNPDKSWRPVGL